MGTITYTEVKTFLKKQSHIMTQCKTISFFTLTPNYLVYARKLLLINSIQGKLILFLYKDTSDTKFLIKKF